MWRRCTHISLPGALSQRVRQQIGLATLAPAGECAGESTASAAFCFHAAADAVRPDIWRNLSWRIVTHRAKRQIHGGEVRLHPCASLLGPLAAPGQRTLEWETAVFWRSAPSSSSCAGADCTLRAMRS